MKEEAIIIQQEMLKEEKISGTQNWELFEKFDYKLQYQTPACTNISTSNMKK